MANSKVYLNFILDQLSLLEGVAARAEEKKETR